MLRLPSQLISLLFLCILVIQPASAVKIVRLQIEYGSDDVTATGGFDISKTNQTMDLELFENVTPITVANFLRYVGDGLYNNIYIHRSVSDFILQTGGFNNISSDPDNEPLGDSLGEVEAFPSILNEPVLSNIRGTVAMAKLGAEPGQPEQPDSATSEWFINLNDNSANLDAQNSGFTVFASVIDDGMEIADQIESFPVIDAGFTFGSPFSNFPLSALPLADYDSNSVDPAFQSNLVMILSAIEIDRPILRFSPTGGDFGVDLSGDTVGRSIDVVLTNTGNETLLIDDINAGGLAVPFSIQLDECSGASLEPLSDTPESSCTLSLLFQSVVIGVFTDSLIISYSSNISDEVFSVSYALSGEGSDVGAPEISTVNTFDVGTSQVAGFEMSRELKINNIGQDSLQVLAITGLSDTSFSQDNDCINQTELIAPGEFCTILVGFAASDFGEETATLSIESSDPINSTINIELSGNGDGDSDGVVTAIENAAPNAGDANFDGFVDSQQNTVASFIAQSGEYLSLVVEGEDVVTRISVTSDENDSELPEGVSFKYGILEYDVIVDTPSDSIKIGLVFPAGDVPNALYFFGETTDNEVPHWFEYPVIEVLPNVTLFPSSSTRNLMTVFVQDGGPGDADQQVNGRIHIGPSIASFSPSSASSGGFINIVFIAFQLLILILVSRRYKY